MSDKPPRERRGPLIAIAAIVLILLPLAYSLLAPLLNGNVTAAEALLEMPDPEHEACIRETEYMRFHHWELLRGVREEVVRYGQRGDVSLAKCRNCHESRDTFWVTTRRRRPCFPA